MTTTLPVQKPYSQPVYSSLAFAIIAMALSRKTKTTYQDLLNVMAVHPLGLKNTGVSPGDTDPAVIPPLDPIQQDWGADYGFSAP